MTQQAAVGDDPTNDYIRHVACDAAGGDYPTVEMLDGPEPPDPDAHGNLRAAFKCAACGERGGLLMPRRGGTVLETSGFVFAAELDAPEADHDY